MKSGSRPELEDQAVTRPPNRGNSTFRILRDVFRYPRPTYHVTIRIVAGILNLKAGFQPR
jgi:hypothetical protein